MLLRKGSTATIPPCKNTGYWDGRHPRNEAVTALKSGHLADWKTTSGYHQRSLAETAMPSFLGCSSSLCNVTKGRSMSDNIQTQPHESKPSKRIAVNPGQHHGSVAWADRICLVRSDDKAVIDKKTIQIGMRMSVCYSQGF